MKEIQTDILIQVSAETIWKILMDFAEYPNWNPFIKSISGDQKEGGHLTAFLQPPGESGMTFTPIVMVHKPNQEFRWLGKLWGGGFFNGEHFFILNDLGNNTVRFIHGEKFTGMLVGILGGLLKNTKNGFELMNKALKEKAEGKK